MAGIGHRGMFRRKAGDSFLYMQTEVGGLIAGYSHLKLRSDYGGSCIQIGDHPNQTDYGFLSGLVTLSQVDSDFASNQDIYYWYDQILSNDFPANVSSRAEWIKSTNEFSFNQFGFNIPSTTGAISTLTSTDAFSMCLVFKSDTSTPDQDWLLSGGTLGDNYRLGFASSNDFNCQIYGSSGGRIERRYNNANFPFDTDYHVLILTYDGSGTPSGISLYVDDLTTELTGTTTTVGTFGSGKVLFSQIALGKIFSITGTEFNGYIGEFLFFDKELNGTERAAVKTVLNQYPPYALL